MGWDQAGWMAMSGRFFELQGAEGALLGGVSPFVWPASPGAGRRVLLEPEPGLPTSFQHALVCLLL